MDVDRPRLAVVRAAPERLEQPLARVDDPGLRGERPQELELDVGELDRAPVDLDRAPREVDRDLTGVITASSRAGRGADARRSSARTRLRNSRIENGFVM